MSGHSKWATIKRQKGVNDAKRGQHFTKLSMAITLAVKQGGNVSNPDDNPRLRLAIDAARSANMPKENIERAIARASGTKDSEMSEVVYEGFGPGGISVIVEAITDNKQRTTPEIKSIFDKNGGTFGVPGSVTYQFEQKGMITVLKKDKNLDEIFLIAAECGADDVEDGIDECFIYTAFDDVSKVRQRLIDEGLEVASAETIRKPIVSKLIEDSTMSEKIFTFMDKLENHDDVQKVFANFDISE